MIQNRVYEAMVSGNRRLRERLSELIKLDSELAPVRPSLFYCDVCSLDLMDPKTNFLHNKAFHPEVDEETPSVEEDGQVKVEEVFEHPSNVCSVCSVSLPDLTGLQLHSLLHQDLLLLHCPVWSCGQVFGAPSKLKLHVLKEHGTMLLAENHKVVKLNEKIRITR